MGTIWAPRVRILFGDVIKGTFFSGAPKVSCPPPFSSQGLPLREVSFGGALKARVYKGENFPRPSVEKVGLLGEGGLCGGGEG